jgi:hypothetical protein
VLLRRPDIYAAPTYIGDVSTSPGARVQVRPLCSFTRAQSLSFGRNPNPLYCAAVFEVR